MGEQERRRGELRQAKWSALKAALGLGPRLYPQTPEQRFAKAMDYAERQMVADWGDKPCALLGHGNGALCSKCQYPPCHGFEEGRRG